MTFAEADAQFEELRRRYQLGTLTADQYDAELRRLMVMEGTGRWWAKARESGAWHYYDKAADRWIPAAPPSALSEEPSPASPSALAAAPGPLATTGPAAASAAGPFGPYPPPSAADMADLSSLGTQPSLSGAVKVFFGLFSLLIPVLGLVLFFVYRRKPHAADRAAARLFLILGVISLALSCLCSGVFVVAVQSALLNWAP